MAKRQKKDGKVFLRPSQAGIWMNCPGSIHAKGGKFPFADEQFNGKGDIAHHFLHLLMEAGKFENWSLDDIDELDLLNDFTPEVKKLYHDNKNEIRQWVNFSFRYVANLINDFYDAYGKETIEILSESNRSHTGRTYGIGGTADVVIVTPEILHVLDLKTGIIEVEAHGNEQLIAYANLFAKHYKRKNVRVSIIQPPTGTIHTENIEVSRDYFDFLETHVVKKDLITGPHCKYCPAGISCKKLKEELDNFLTFSFDGVTSDNVTDDFIYWLDRADALTKQSEFLRDKIKTLLEFDPAIIPGYHLGSRGIARRWMDGVTADMLSKTLKLKKGDVIEPKLRTPKQIEEMVKPAYQEKLKDFIIQPTTKVLKKI